MPITGITFSPIGREVLRLREGDRLVAYYDTEGVLTISVGVTTASGLIKVTPGLRITQAESAALFAKASEKYADHVRRALTRMPTQEQFDAFGSICYNIGPGGFAGSTFVKRFNAGRPVAEVVEAIKWWNKPAVIQGRRAAEAEQFASSYATALPRPTPAQPRVKAMGGAVLPTPQAAAERPVPPKLATKTIAATVAPPAETKPASLWNPSGGLFGPLIDKIRGRA